MAHDDLAFTLAEYACRLRADTIGSDAVTAARTNIFDTLACAVAGSSAPGVPETVSLAAEWGGSTQASILVYGHRVPAHHAAWVNGMMAHARDYDDTHDEAVLHAGVSAVPAALAAAELKGSATGADLIAGVTAGLDVIGRLGRAITVGVVESGWIYTAILGYFGATLAAGRVLGLTPEQMVNALGITYSQVAGNHQVTRDAALTKRMQPGFAAQAALISVQLALRGIRGVQRTFDGEDGFFRVYLQGRVDREAVLDGLGQRFESTRLSYKPYPACRFTHTPIDAALKLRASLGGDLTRVERVEVLVNRQCHEAVCTPDEVRKHPRTVVQAQFSIPYTVAVALRNGQVRLADFTQEALDRSEVLALAARVDGRVDGDLERDWGRHISPAIIRAYTWDGAVLEERVDYARGHAQRPMTPTDFDAKLDDCMRFTAKPLPSGTPERLRSLVDDLEHLPEAGLLARSLTATFSPSAATYEGGNAMTAVPGHLGDGKIRAEDLQRLRERIGVRHPLRPWNTEATVDNIRHFAWAAGDDNPLFTDEGYASATRWSTLVAPPTFAATFSSGGGGGAGGGGLPGVFSLHAEDVWEFRRPVLLGDRAGGFQRLLSVDEKESSWGGKTVHQIQEYIYEDDQGQMICRKLHRSIRVERMRVKRTGAAQEPQERYSYSEAELRRIAADYESEVRRGPEVRFYDDVVEGQSIGHLVKGPLTANDLVVWIAGWGSPYAKSCRQAFEYMKAHPGSAIIDPQTNIRHFPESAHWDEGLARRSGLSAGYDIGTQRVAWMAHLVTNWMGDDGMLKRLQVQLRAPNLMGDTTWCRGEVIRRHPTSDGAGAVELRLWGENQRGEIHTTGSALVELHGRGGEA